MSIVLIRYPQTRTALIAQVLKPSIFCSFPVFCHQKQIRPVWSLRFVGAFSGRVPPLPIPNRVVKPASADGTEVDASGE
jgi:hypothetical protein